MLRERTAPAAAVELSPHQLPGQQESPLFAAKTPPGTLKGQGRFWGQEALSSTAGRKKEFSIEPALPRGEYAQTGSKGHENQIPAEGR